MKGKTLSKHSIFVAGLFCIGLSLSGYTKNALAYTGYQIPQPSSVIQLEAYDHYVGASYATSCPVLDLSSSYASYIPSEYQTSFTNKTKWFVTQHRQTVGSWYPNYGHHDYITVAWTDSTTAELDFGATHVNTNESVHTVQIMYKGILEGTNNCDITSTYYLTTGYLANGTGYTTDQTENGGNPSPVFSYGFSINYPSGYDGETVPESFEVVPETPDLSDDIKMYWKYEDRKITLKNETPIPPLDLNTMQCRYMVVSVETETAVLDNFANCRHDNIQEVEVEEYGDYEVIMTINYDINDDGIILPDFEQIAEVSYPLTIDGTNNEGNAGAGGFTEANSPWEDCLTANEFPFIQIESCLGNLAKITNLLTFDRVRFGSGWSTDNGCRTLGTIGEWLPMSNKTVCPMFPETMRNIITPFISAGLGLMALKFLINGTGSSEGNW